MDYTFFDDSPNIDALYFRRDRVTVLDCANLNLCRTMHRQRFLLRQREQDCSHVIFDGHLHAVVVERVDLAVRLERCVNSPIRDISVND